jgi:hypothetical protein
MTGHLLSVNNVSLSISLSLVHRPQGIFAPDPPCVTAQTRSLKLMSGQYGLWFCDSSRQVTNLVFDIRRAADLAELDWWAGLSCQAGALVATWQQLCAPLYPGQVGAGGSTGDCAAFGGALLQTRVAHLQTSNWKNCRS